MEGQVVRCGQSNGKVWTFKLIIWKMSQVCQLNIYVCATGTSINTANHTSDILQYPMNNKIY